MQGRTPRVPRRDAVMTAPESTRDEAKTCPFCAGTGVCAKCEGPGFHTVRKGRLGLKREVQCAACDGSGECRLCHGAGVPSEEAAGAWPGRD